MQRLTSRSRFQKADVALLLAGMGLVVTITLTIFSLVDGQELVTTEWIGSIMVSSGGLLACWFWPPSKHDVSEAVRDSCGIWAIGLVFAVAEQDWREAVPFATVLIVAFALSRWLKRRQATISGRTDNSVSE